MLTEQNCHGQIAWIFRFCAIMFLAPIPPGVSSSFFGNLTTWSPFRETVQFTPCTINRSTEEKRVGRRLINIYALT